MAKRQQKQKQQKKDPLSIGRALRPYYLGLIMALAFVLYGNTLGHQFAFDDSIVITENEFTKKGLAGIPDLLTRDFFEGIYGKKTELTGGRYRPLSLVMFAIEYQFFGENAFIGHLVNIFFYGLTVWLFFLSLERLFYKNSAIPHIASFLFLIHPIHIEVVANIKSRDEILCLFFLMLSLYAVFRAIDKERKKWTVIGLLAYFMALMAKETAITYLAIIPLFIFVFRKDTLRAKLPFFVGMGTIAIGYIILRVTLVGMIGGSDSPDIMENPFVSASFTEKYATVCLILTKYLGLLFFPHPLSSDYSFNQIPLVGWDNIWAIFGVLSHLGMLVYAFFSIFLPKGISHPKNETQPPKRTFLNPILGLGFLCYLAPLSIVSNLVFNIGAPMGERFLFIPSVGFCLIFAWVLVKIFKVAKVQERIQINYGIFIVLGLIFSVSMYKIIDRNRDWYDNMTLFDADVLVTSNSAKMLYYHGNTHLKYYINNKTPEQVKHLKIAEKSFLKGFEINPEFTHISYNLGNLYDLLGDGEKAKFYLEKTLELKPTHVKATTLLGKVYGRHFNNPSKAIFYLERVVNDYNQQGLETLQNLANAYAIGQQYDKAIPIYKKIIKEKPDNAKSYLNLAITYDKMGDKVNATSNYKRAFSLDPSLQK